MAANEARKLAQNEHVSHQNYFHATPLLPSPWLAVHNAPKRKIFLHVFKQSTCVGAGALYLYYSLPSSFPRNRRSRPSVRLLKDQRWLFLLIETSSKYSTCAPFIVFSTVFWDGRFQTHRCILPHVLSIKEKSLQGLNECLLNSGGIIAHNISHCSLRKNTVKEDHALKMQQSGPPWIWSIALSSDLLQIARFKVSTECFRFLHHG